MRVTILSALGGEAPARVAARPATTTARTAPQRPAEPEPEAPAPAPVLAFVEREEDADHAQVAAKARPEAAPISASATTTPAQQARKAAAEAEKAAREAKQEQMLFEPVTRGRFEKSEPTIVNGEDLDVPTFLRRNLRVK